jgi:hypothetical protein
MTKLSEDDYLLVQALTRARVALETLKDITVEDGTAHLMIRQATISLDGAVERLLELLRNLREDATPAPKPPWISVDERMPDNCTDCFFSDNGTTALRGAYLDDEFVLDGKPYYGVRFWAPFPKGPLAE